MQPQRPAVVTWRRWAGRRPRAWGRGPTGRWRGDAAQDTARLPIPEKGEAGEQARGCLRSLIIKMPMVRRIQGIAAPAPGLR